MKFVKIALLAVLSLSLFAGSNSFSSESKSTKVISKKSKTKNIKRKVASATKEDICGKLVIGRGTNWSLKTDKSLVDISSNVGWPTYDNDGNKCGYEFDMCICGVTLNSDGEEKSVVGEVEEEQVSCGPHASCKKD